MPGQLLTRWRWCPGFEGSYKVSNDGPVKSVERDIPHWRGGFAHIRSRILIPSFDKNGYQFVSLSRPKEKAKPYKVHALVLSAFVGPKPRGMVCRHLDGNNQNNHLSNLKWGTPRSNTEDRRKHGRNKVNQGSLHGWAKLTEEKVREIRARQKKGDRIADLAREFGVRPLTISGVVHYRSWKHI